MTVRKSPSNIQSHGGTVNSHNQDITEVHVAQTEKVKVGQMNIICGQEADLLWIDGNGVWNNFILGKLGIRR